MRANVNLSSRSSGVVTLERSSLRSEGCPTAPSWSDEVLRIGCRGHSTRTVDFHRLPTWRANSPDKRFEAIGTWAPGTETLDLSGLDPRPQRLAPYHLPERVGGGRCCGACRRPATPTISSSAVRLAMRSPALNLSLRYLPAGLQQYRKSAGPSAISQKQGRFERLRGREVEIQPVLGPTDLDAQLVEIATCALPQSLANTHLQSLRRA